MGTKGKKKKKVKAKDWHFNMQMRRDQWGSRRRRKLIKKDPGFKRGEGEKSERDSSFLAKWYIWLASELARHKPFA